MKKQLLIMLMVLVGIMSFGSSAKAYTIGEEFQKNYTGEKTIGSDTPYTYRTWNGQKWGHSWLYGDDLKYFYNLTPISYDVTYNYDTAYEMVELTNEERRKAGKSELKTNDLLMETAMKRATETALYWSHIRPNATSCRTCSMFIKSENINTGSDIADEIIQDICESKGHYNNMINDEWVYVGCGNIKTSGGYFSVQIFCDGNNYYEIDSYKDETKKIDLSVMKLSKKANYTERVTTEINPTYIKALYADLELNSITPKNVGTVCDVKVSILGKADYCRSVYPTSDQYIITSLTPSTCVVTSDNKLSFVGAGKAKVKVSLKAFPSIKTEISFDITKNEKVIVKNDNLLVYSVTSNKKREACVKSRMGDETTIKIPDTVVIDGTKYKVTKINNGALKNNKNLKKVIIGKNVKSIGKEAFSGCSSLKSVTIKSKSLKSVGKNALKGIHKKAVIRVPSSKLSTYKKLLKGKGQKKTVKIKK